MKTKKTNIVIFSAFFIFLSMNFTQRKIDRHPGRKSQLDRPLLELGTFQKTPPSMKDAAKYAPDQILVRFKPTISQRNISSLISSFSSWQIRRIPVVNVYQLKIPDDSTVEEMIYILNQNQLVEYAGPNYIARITVTPNDTFFNYQYALSNSGQDIGVPGSPQGIARADIKATSAWEETRGEEEIIIAVIDTGIDLEHPDLKDKIVSSGRDFVNDDMDATDDQGHGTFTAGIAAAETNNNEGIAGVAWNCKILPIKAMDAEGEGYYSDLIESIVYAVDNDADIINLSLGGSAHDSALEDAVKYAVQNDVVVVAAVGPPEGYDTGPVMYPAAYDDCLAVAATDYDDDRADWSNFGPEVDVAAPGVRIISTVPTWYFGEGSIPYGFSDGTSFSCPYVAGMAALIKSEKPWMTAEQVMDVIRYSSDDINESEHPGFDDYVGYGRINMEKALVPIKLK